MTVMASGADDNDLTAGEFATYLEKVKVPVPFGGLVFQHRATFQIEDDGSWRAL